MELSIIKNRKGISLIEVLLAMTIFALFSTAVFILSLDTIQRDSKNELDNLALQYAQEGIEAVRNMRDRDYLSLNNGDFGLSFAGDTWSFIAAPETVDSDYFRTITVEDVYRDELGNIADSGTFDPDVKKISSEVTWSLHGIYPRSSTLETYISNWSGDDWLQTTCTEFEGGILNNTETVSTPEPPADNCTVELSDIEEASEFLASSDIGDHGNDVVVDGNYAYMANNKANRGFTIVNASDPANPVIASSLDIGGKGIHLAKSGNYIFITVNKSDAELTVIDVSDPADPSVVATKNMSEGFKTISISGNYLYGGSTDNDGFIVLDISDPLDPDQVANLEFDDEIQAIAISGNYAYVGTEEDDSGFQVINITNPLLPAQVTSLDVGEEVNAIVISGPYAYIGTEENNDSFHVVNISNPGSPVDVESIDVGGEIQDITISGDYAYAAMDIQNSGLSAINISIPAQPALVYSLDVTGKGTGIASDASYIYLSLTTNNRGLVIIGVTSSVITNTGDYTSVVYDTGVVDPRYNFIAWEDIAVPGGTINFKIRTGSSAVNVLSGTWVGSDGTDQTFYQNSRTNIVLDPARSGDRYFQFKAYFFSNGASSPSLESVRINYTP